MCSSILLARAPFYLSSGGVKIRFGIGLSWKMVSLGLSIGSLWNMKREDSGLGCRCRENEEFTFVSFDFEEIKT